MCSFPKSTFSRGSFLTGAALAAGATALAPIAGLATTIPHGIEYDQIWMIAGRPKAVRSAARQIWIVEANSHEALIAYLTVDGVNKWYGTPQYPGLDHINRLLRDRRFDVVAPGGMDVVLIEAAYETQQEYYRRGYVAPMIVTSAFRTSETNSIVGGAARSWHLPGKALDFWVPGIPYDVLFDAARSRRYVGGMGRYRDGHVHIDTGPPRLWEG